MSRCTNPIVNAIAPTGDDFSWIEEIGRAEIEIDISDRLANAAAHRDFSGRLGRQLDTGDRNASVELRERGLDSGADCRLVIRERSPAIDIVGCEPAAEVEFKLVRRAIRCRWLAAGDRPAASAQIDRTSGFPRLGRDLGTRKVAPETSKPQHGDRGHRACANPT
jgi:hypothetical protein